MFDTARVPGSGIVSTDSLKIYTGILGQIGDIVLFTPTARRIKQLFPNSRITWAVSARYREAGELVRGLPYVDRLFVTELYFEKLAGKGYGPWHLGWPFDLRGDDEAGALQVPMVGLFGTSYVPAYSALYPENPQGLWLQAEGPLEGIRPESVLEAVARVLARGITADGD